MRETSAIAVSFALMFGCTGGAASDDDGDDDGPDPSTSDPFAAPPDRGAGLTDVSSDLDAVLEHGALATACADYERAPGDRRLRLLCGKAMFFDEAFGTSGVPKPIVTWLLDSFPDEVGPGFARFGMVADPRSAEGLPLGLPPGPQLGGNVDTVAFGCASCHFGRLPDGRYAVGAPNHDYAYGRHILVMTLLPSLAIPGADPNAHDADALAVVQPFRTRMDADPALGTALLTALLPLITGGGGALPAFDPRDEHHYATWADGTMDFLIAPLPLDDGVHTISKISSLWSFPDDDELRAAGADNLMLGWTGGTASLHNFLAGFVDIGGGPAGEWPRERLAPLHDYVMSLRAPEPLDAPAAAEVARGREVWLASGCQDCHGGPRGMGTEVYTYDEIGTDDAMRWWVDGPDHDGEPYNDIRFQPGDSITHGIKSPRLVGLWAMSRFLHNGSLDSLEQLLCVAPRPGVTEAAFADRGHTYGCDLSADDRGALLTYLRSH
jgi:mono/diheme cytochrome c family protein